MTTKLLASRTNPADIKLATECVEWHAANCVKCTRGEICTGIGPVCAKRFA